MRYGKELFVSAVTCGLLFMLLSCSQKQTNENEPSSVVAKKPGWLNGPMVAGGSNHEPSIFYYRRGGNSATTLENFFNTHTEEFVSKLKDNGSTFYMTHAFKGFGLVAEKEEIALAKLFASRLHAKGLQVGAYIGSSLAYETLLLEKPEAEEWLVPDYLGQGVYYHTQFWRRRPYFRHPGYREYIKQALKVAVNDIGADLIHFDNPANQAIPAVFHHPMAIQDFREYLKNKYTPEKLKERIGFSDPSRIVPPAYPNPGSFQSFDDPITQEWIDFRCQMLADHYKEMSAYIRSLNPEVAVEINPHGITGSNRAWESGVDFGRLLPNVDAYVCEDGNPASITDEGALISNIRSYKIGRTLNNIVFNGVGSSPVQAAETMAYNPYSFHRPNESLKKFVMFYHKNWEHLGNTKTVADVAILRSFPSMAYSNYSTHQSTVLFEQVLIQCKIPFDIIYDNNLKDLSKYSVLILANQECLADSHLELIREFVRQGGGLVATENSSLYDDWRRERESFGLKDLFGIDRPYSIKSIRVQDGGAMESIEEYELRQAGKTIKNQLGKGKVAYIPLIEPSKNRPPTSPMRNIYWKLPLNYSEMADAIKWAAGGEFSVYVNSPLTVTMELTEQEGKMMLHLINYNIDKEKLVKNISVSLKIPEGKQIKELLLHSPDREGDEIINYTIVDGRAVFTVPTLEVYDLIVAKFI